MFLAFVISAVPSHSEKAHVANASAHDIILTSISRPVESISGDLTALPGVAGSCGISLNVTNRKF